MEHERKSGLYFPWWLIGLLVVGICVLIYFATRPTSDIKTAENEKAAIEQKIDSTETEQKTDRQSMSDKSNEVADQSNHITNSVRYETPIISDTTYAAKCEYIAKYIPTN